MLKDRNVFLSSGPGCHKQQQNHKCHGFQTAGSRAGGPADEHEDHAEALTRLCQQRLIDGSKSCSTESDGLEQAIQKFFSYRHGPQRAGIVPFQNAGHDPTGQKKRQTGHQNQLGIDTEFSEASMLCNLLPNHKTETSYHHKRAQCQQYDGVRLKLHQAGTGGDAAENVEARIAEGGNGMENAPFQCATEAKFRQEPKKQNRCSDALDGKAAFQHGFLEVHNAVHIADTEGLGHNKPLLEADALSQQKHQHGSGGHEAQTADLNQADNDRLSEAAPLGPGIIQHQACNAGGRGGCEQGRAEAAGNTAAGGNGQCQKRRTQQDNGTEGQGNDLGSAQIFRPFLHPEGIQPGSQGHNAAPVR